MSEVPEQSHEGELIFYQTPEGTVRIEVLYQSETFWLNQKRIAELFGVDVRTVSYHLKEVYDSGELSPDRTLRKIWRVQTEGNREVRLSEGQQIFASKYLQFLPSEQELMLEIERERKLIEAAIEEASEQGQDA